MTDGRPYDVLVVGEVLVELSSPHSLNEGRDFKLSFSGDVLAGTMVARLALGDDLETAARLGASAAALSLSGQGGTGHLSALEAARDNAVAS